MPTGVYERKKKPKAKKWSAEQRANYEATVKARGHALLNKMSEEERIEHRKAQQRAYWKKRQANGGPIKQDSATEFPLDAIPERAPKQQRAPKTPIAVLNGFANGNGNGKHAKALDKVHAEYDINSDSMTLVLGKLRLPFRVKV